MNQAGPIGEEAQKDATEAEKERAIHELQYARQHLGDVSRFLLALSFFCTVQNI